MSVALSTQPVVFSEAALAKFRELLTHYPEKHSRAALIPTLRLAQREFGCVSNEVIEYVAGLLGLAPVQVHEVVGFYTLFHREPPGQYHLQVCTNVSCMLGGSQKIVDHVCKRLGIRPDEKTADGKFSLETVECLASCGTAPAMMVNDTYCENLTPEVVDRILDHPENAGEQWPHTESNFVRRWKTDDTLIVTRRFNNADPVSVALYERDGGNVAWRKALKEMKPSDVTEVVKQSGLVGRGGAGFSAGLKWSFIDKKSKEPCYLTVNADEGEPGTFKDRYLMEQDPHMFLEGTSIACYAIGAHKAYVYIRGELAYAQQVVQKAIDARYAAGLLGKNILGSGFDLDIYTHSGAGAYICGEETGLLESLEGKRGQPRSKPPFPAVIGLFKGPTIINNVETLANVPDIIAKGAAWFASIGTPKNTGTRMFTVSGHVMKPGYYELPLGIPLRTLIYDVCGGLRPGRQLAAVIPGGASSGWLLPSEIDVGMDFNSLRAVGSMAGSGAVMVIDDSVCLLKVLLRIEEFFQDESCGQCTPCREGTGWLARVLHKIEHGEGTKADIDLAFSIANNMSGMTICVLSDAAAGPMQSVFKKFKPVLEAHVEHRGCPQAH